MIRAYWHKSINFGDTLTPIVLSFLLKEEIKLAARSSKGKLLGIGSIITALRENDIVWGSGLIREVRRPMNRGVKILAVRGPKTRQMMGFKDEVVYGDPGILLPLIYDPVVDKKYKVGIIPHFIETEVMAKDGEHRINLSDDWKKVVNEMKSCERIVSSSLHGIVCAEAYGIPVTWAKYSDKIIGGQFKFQDYFLGTGRAQQKYWDEIPPIENLENRQKLLIDVLKKYYGK
jgi:pyruvyltransferase